MDVLEAAENVDFLVCEDDWDGLGDGMTHGCEMIRRTSCSAGVFNGEFGLAVFAGDTADCSAEMFA